MIVGFTGTQRGMTPQQKRFLREGATLFTEFHEGDCIGADAEAVRIVREVNPSCKIISHPPIADKKRAHAPADKVLPKKEYLDRNHDIVNACEVLIAMPNTELEKVRSGTWATIRYAKKVGKNLLIVYPDGSLWM